jgi:hypothetical protein
MKDRCFNPNSASRQWYSERGITVCDRWKDDFAAFLEDMGPRPSRRHSIDRINVNGNYEPGNCRWADPKEQALNRRGVSFALLKGKKVSIPDFAREMGVKYGSLNWRMKHKGESAEEAAAHLLGLQA